MRKKKILVADDSRVFRALEEAFLAQRGYEVIHAADGAAAVRMAFEEKPDLVLLDIQMPIMDGAQVLATLKANPQTKSIPVVVVTTIGRVQDKSLLSKGGADAVLSKPINGGELLGLVKEFIGGPGESKT